MLTAWWRWPRTISWSSRANPAVSRSACSSQALGSKHCRFELVFVLWLLIQIDFFRFVVRWATARARLLSGEDDDEEEDASAGAGAGRERKFVPVSGAVLRSIAQDVLPHLRLTERSYVHAACLLFTQRASVGLTWSLLTGSRSPPSLAWSPRAAC